MGELQEDPNSQSVEEGNLSHFAQIWKEMNIIV